MLAIAFLTVVLVLVTVLFGLADTGTKSLQAFRTDRTLHYAADAALEDAIKYLIDNPTKGTDTPGNSDCPMTINVDQGITAASPKAIPSLTSGSQVNVKCTAYSGSGIDDAEGVGFPRPRDVLITVTCNTSTATVDESGFGNELTVCGGGGNARKIGEARVRFEIDYSYNGSCTTLPCPAAPACQVVCLTTARARVPKIVSYQIER